MRTVWLRPSTVIALVLSSIFSAASTHVLTVSRSAINFGTQPVSTTSTQMVAMSNSGTASILIQSVTISGSTAFQESGFTGAVTLAPSQTLSLTVSFTPIASGSYSGTLSISATGGASKSIALSGSGTSGASSSGSTAYSNIDDSTTLNSGGSNVGWGWCGSTSCAGGGSTASQQISWGQQPSLDGSGSVQFMVSGSAFADGLWWYKVGPNDSVANFQFDFWLNVSQAATSYSQALEFDVFQYIVPTRYMFGTQCDYAKGYRNGAWDVWDAGAGQWTHTSFACPGFVPGDWYHITWNFHRTSDKYEHYDSVAIQHYDSTGTTQLGSSNTTVNIAWPSGPLPSGWSGNLGKF